MEFETGAFFTEREENDVGGFVIIESSETGPGYGEPSYRIAEKWEPSDREPLWVVYWVPEDSLLARVERGACSHTKNVTEKQMRGVMNLAGVSPSPQTA